VHIDENVPEPVYYDAAAPIISSQNPPYTHERTPKRLRADSHTYTGVNVNGPNAAELVATSVPSTIMPEGPEGPSVPMLAPDPSPYSQDTFNSSDKSADKAIVEWLRPIIEGH
jgi:hypothetical protein